MGVKIIKPQRMLTTSEVDVPSYAKGAQAERERIEGLILDEAIRRGWNVTNLRALIEIGKPRP